MTALQTLLVKYDGKHNDVLQEIMADLRPSSKVLREAIVLASNADVTLAAGATWLLRTWVESGVSLSEPVMQRLAAELPRIELCWAKLHVCQTVRSLEIPSKHAAAFARFLEACRGHRNPLVRAWAIDGLCRLGRSHKRYVAASRRALLAGDIDPRASVRARARRIRAGD